MESVILGIAHLTISQVEVPPHGFLNAVFKGCGGVPVELGLELGGVYGVAEVVAGAVLDVCDEALAGAGGIAEDAVCGGNEDVHEFDV